MPTTFKPVVYADNKRQDGTYNVKIRVTHRRQTLKLSTNMYVAAHQMTRALKLKDQSIIDEANHRQLARHRRTARSCGRRYDRPAGSRLHQADGAEQHGFRTRFYRLRTQKGRNDAPRNGHRVSDRLKCVGAVYRHGNT